MIVSVTISDSRESEISNAIESVVNHVDRVILIDTGIADGTVNRAREIAGEKLLVFPHEWVDFSTARNAGLEAAESIGAEWIIILDSDERIDFEDLNLRDILSDVNVDVFRIESEDGHYPKEKILRASAKIRYVGVTHETPIGGGARTTLQGATFSELPKSNEQLTRKFLRDANLLAAHVSVHPEDPRWWYYLGASYEGLGNRELAAEAFGECVKRRRFGDEAAWAAYKQAEQLFILERFDEAIETAARGMGANATFAECAWLAGVAASRLNRTDQAIAWARIAESVGRYKGCGEDRAWFKHLPALYELPYDVLRHSLRDLAAKSQADSDFVAAKRARVGASDETELDWISITSGPNRDEARTLLNPPPIKDVCSSAHLTRIDFIPPNGYRPMNPSVCTHEGELWCVVRTVNYTVHEGRYTIYDSDGIVRTENYLGRLVNNVLTNPRQMLDLDTSTRQDSQIVGYEDIRLVSVDGKLTGSSTVCDRDASRRLIARLHFSDQGDIERAVVQPSNQLHEKNWMPLNVDGKFVWIYSLDPTAVLPGPLRQCPFSLEHLRGGAAIKFEDGYLCVTHEIITNNGRVYLHRFVRLDVNFNVVAVSGAWVFAHHGVEFCAGLVLDKNELVMTYGIEDREAWVIRVDVSDILDKLNWITIEDLSDQNDTNPPAITAITKKWDLKRALRVTVVNSPHERCGIREYGLQLNRSLSTSVDLTDRTYMDVSVNDLILSDVTLVHFENGIVSNDFHQTLLDSKMHGAKVVFCCHNYQLNHVLPFLRLVDHFVLHKDYAAVPQNSTKIPLGCPVYLPLENRSQLRARFDLPEDKLIVTSLGFLAEWKRWGDIIEAVSEELANIAFLQINTAVPFWPDKRVIDREVARIKKALSRCSGRHSIEFLSENELLDKVHISDLGFVFHPIHTGSVSAATKQFVSGRCPLIVTGSSHSSDLEQGIVRVESFDPRIFAQEIRHTVTNEKLLAQLTEEMKQEYARLNMNMIADRYLQLFKEIVSK